MEALKLLDFMLLATLKGAPAQIIQPLLQLDHPNLTWQVFGDQKFSPCPVPRPSTEDGTGPKFRSWIIELHNFQSSPGWPLPSCPSMVSKTLFKPVFLSFSILGRKNHEKSLEPEKHPQGDKLEGWLSRFDSHWVLSLDEAGHCVSLRKKIKKRKRSSKHVVNSFKCLRRDWSRISGLEFAIGGFLDLGMTTTIPRCLNAQKTIIPMFPTISRFSFPTWTFKVCHPSGRK